MASPPHDKTRAVAESDYSADERTLCERASDDESYDGRPSGDLSDADRDILESEDERERLLTQKEGLPGLSGLFKGKGVNIGKRVKQEMRERKRDQEDESSALMYEMGEGIGASNFDLRSRRSSESDVQRLVANKAQKNRRGQLWRRLCIYVSIVVLFVFLLAAAYRLSTPADSRATATMLSNGTSLFAPTTILISLDGFRADFLYRNLTPTLNQFIQQGISPEYMLPSFPSVTFPNHYTMATGMYPEAHGVVGNSFWDPALEQEFYYTDAERSLQPHWWGGEPIWVTAEKQNVRSAVHMWPGSEAHILNQDIAYVDKYNGSEKLSNKVDRIMNLLDTPGPMDIGAASETPRPQLIAAYVPDVDGDGHRYGPNSTEIRKTISKVDSMLGDLLAGLHARNLTNIVNVVVVSDHGMATTDVSRLIQLESLIDRAELSHIDGWPLYGLRPKNESDLNRLYDQLKVKAEKNPNIEVYLRDVDMPARYHFSNNDRIAPLWIVPKTGWAIVTKDEFDVEVGKKKGEVYHPRGLHGYDHEHPLMRAIFAARGPAFPHAPGSRMEPFQNIHLYNMICDSIGLHPAPNNGTLRLPLTPVGLHNDTTVNSYVPEDPVATPSSPVSSDLASPDPTSSSIAASASGSNEEQPQTTTVPAASPTGSAPPQATDADGKEDWWEWFTHKADEVGEWIDDVWHKHVPGKEEGAAKDPADS
ncbi:Phosphodiest-domain-containing protein [Dothidotthia symphoricarpi CBS 119687]|uniref:Phosphodiest-domain-containing protein n=1 Tax=Dothidotthia symphoricarpi CBS 119687 TaxID=1392245 RepID=A0A6A6AMC3_9PLEO|nr:Phosphodiest-domain-containing protein [Dothidotthia symphoricarpi CBS 119687]KAF2132716.1 Phosphodiest-domain-containing protein [Dothidotthia symphoricarpi CBS 119687]